MIQDSALAPLTYSPEHSAAQTEADLIFALRQGDSMAFQTLVETHSGMVLAIAYSHLQNREAAEDLAQEVFLRVHLALPQLEAPVHISAWMARITRNLAIDWLRRGQRTSQLVQMVSLEKAHEAVADSQASHAREKLEMSEERAMVRRAVTQLPAPLREIILLHYMEDWTLAEIADRLGVHRSTVSRQMDRAHNALRKFLAPALRDALQSDRAGRGLVGRTAVLGAALAALSATAKASVLAEAAKDAALLSASAAPGGGLAAVWSAITKFFGSTYAWFLEGGIKAASLKIAAVGTTTAVLATGGVIIANHGTLGDNDGANVAAASAPTSSLSVFSPAETQKIEAIERDIIRQNDAAALPAAQALLDGAAQGSDSLRAKAHFLLAWAYEVRNARREEASDREEGLRHLSEAFRLAPDLKNDPYTPAVRGHLLIRNQPRATWDQTLAEARQEIAQNPRNAASRLYLGRMLMVISQKNDNTANLATDAERTRFLNEAIQELKTATRLSPERYTYWVWYVTALHRAGQTKEARAAAEKALAQADLSEANILPDETDPYELVGATMGSDPQAANYSRDMFAKHPERLRLRLSAALAYQDADAAKAIEIMESLLADLASGKARAPVSCARLEVRALYKLGHLYHTQKDNAKSLAAYERLMELSPDYYDVQLNHAVILREMAAAATNPAEKKALLLRAKADCERSIREFPQGSSNQLSSSKALEEIEKELANIK